MINIDLRTTRSYKVTVDSAETLYCILKAAGCHLESYNFISRFSWVPQSSVLKTWDDIQVMDNDSIANIEGVRKAWESEFIFDNNNNLAGIVVPIWHYKDAPHRIYWQLGFGLCYTNPTDVLPDAATHLLDVLQEML